MLDSDQKLRALALAIINGEVPAVRSQLAASPELARACFQEGATRQNPEEFFLHSIGRYIVAGDTALHIAAAACESEIVKALIGASAPIHGANRFGDQPLHAAAAGNPNSPLHNPAAQSETIEALIHAGADPNAINKRGVSPLHVAVRTRCAAAVRTLLELGADPARTNKSGSTPLLLAQYNTGRSGSGTPEAKAQQQQILRLLEAKLTTLH